MKPSHIAFESKAKLLDSVKVFEPSDDEDEPSDEEGASHIIGVDQSGGWPPQDPKQPKRSFSGTGVREPSRLAQRRRANTQQSFRNSDDSSSDEKRKKARLKLKQVSRRP